MRHRSSVKRQNIAAQNARSPETAIAVRKVTSGQGLREQDSAEWVQ